MKTYPSGNRGSSPVTGNNRLSPINCCQLYALTTRTKRDILIAAIVEVRGRELRYIAERCSWKAPIKKMIF